MERTDLPAAYRLCGRVARAHGKTYARAARLLPRRARDHVYAVYAFCRLADDIVDEGADLPVRERARALDDLGARLRAGLAAGGAEHPVLAAVVETALGKGIDASCFNRFLAAMELDFRRDRYDTWGDLCAYMDGSAAVIGEMMLPVLEPLDPAAREPARQLGIAFQLTNFLRDVGEDLDRGRVYLPQEDLRFFGADPRRRRVDDAWRGLMRFEIERNREIYAKADTGIPLLPPASARCVRTARVLYSRILGRIERQGYDVFTRRARVPAAEKALVAARVLLASPYAGHRAGPTPTA